MLDKIKKLKYRRQMLLRAFTVGNLDNPKTAEAITNALTNIDLKLSEK